MEKKKKKKKKEFRREYKEIFFHQFYVMRIIFFLNLTRTNIS